ncbi:MAG: LytTR family DNA-binding domain-containing protein [Bacteroidota bacterium]
MRAVAIDDNRRMHRALERMLERVAPEISLVGTAVSVKEGVEVIREKQPNLLFLDIDLGRDEETDRQTTGFDLLRLIEPANYQIIFITGFGGYVQRALDFEAVAYLHKPLGKDKLVEALQKAQRRFQRRSAFERKLDMELILAQHMTKSLPTRYVFYADSTYFPLKVDNIITFSKDDTLVWVTLADGRRLSRTESLATYERHFADYRQFYRVGQGTLVNLHHAVSLTTSRELMLTNGEQLKLKPQSAAEVRKRLGEL